MTHKAAIVTGSSARIGRSIALRLARLGFDILLHYHTSEEAAQKTGEEIKNLGVECCLIQTNLEEPESVPALFSQIPNDWNLQVLVNNASNFQPFDFHDESEIKLVLH